MDLIKIVINNKTVYVRSEATILQACESINIDVPRFCYHEKLSVAGNCRICLVEVIKSPKPVVSCAIPVSKGMIVFSDTPLVHKARESVLEFLLLNHPLDCPICDQGGECDLQDESLTYGSDRGRYLFDFKRSVEDKECGPIIKTIITRCIHCTRCVRFSAEIAGNEVRGSFGRGEETEIGTYIQSFIKTELSGNLVDLCPVGALTSKPYAYKTRSWESNRVATIDLFDAITSDVVVYTRNQSKIGRSSSEQIIAILPIKNGIYFENWITDRTRYAFDSLYVPNRFNTRDNIKYYEKLDNIINTFINIKFIKKKKSIYFGSQSNLESRYSIDFFIKHLTKVPFTYNQINYTSNVLIDVPSFYSLNKSVNEFTLKPLQNIIMIGLNLRYEASILNTRIRREIKQRGTSYVNLGNYTQLAYIQNHKGNSYRSVIALIENRMTLVKQFNIQSNKTALYRGVNNLRNNQSNFIQQIIRQIAKYIFAKNSKNERFGYIHSNTGSLSFAHRNISNSIIRNKLNNYRCYINIPVTLDNKSKKDIRVFSTHFKNELNHYSIPSFYENTGHVISLNNNVTKHNKVVGVPSKVYNIATLLNYSLAKYGSYYYFWGKSLSKFKKGVRFSSFKKNITSLMFNPFYIKTFFKNQGKLLIFTQPVKDFYIEDQLTSDSITIAECALFLQQDTNKTNFVIEN